MKHKYFRLIAICSLFIACILCRTTYAQPPNVILILVDDQGYGDVASLGNKFIKTPNIDQLGSMSARFTNYHVSPTCSPTRAALLTGRYDNRTGVWHTINGRSILLEQETVMAQVFKENGYATGIFGKWHLGDNYPFRPQDKGFEEVLINGGGGIGQAPDHFDNDYFDDVYLHNGKKEQYKGYCTDVWFENAIRFIENKKGKPFFCFLPTNAAHSPYFVADKYAAPYKNNDSIPNAAFYGMISNVDENIGKLMAYLKKSNQLDNTIVIFTTDNGTAAGVKLDKGGADGFMTKGFNAGMRGEKASMYEGGHRVPLFMHFKKGGITVGKDINELAAHYDLFPTLVELCGLKKSPAIKLDGKSLVPLIKGNNNGFTDRIVIANSQRQEQPQRWFRTAVMQGNWRLVNETELYDLNSDPEQRNNIAAKHPAIINTLKTAYDKWWNELAPGYSNVARMVIGHKTANPVTLYSHDWHTEKVSPWNHDMIRNGYNDNGYWTLNVAEDGTYKIRLRRWPEETHQPINAALAERPAINGTTVGKSAKGKALTVANAKIDIQNTALESPVDGEKEFVEFEVKLKKGEANLRTEFVLEKGASMGAYYVSVEKIN